MHSKRIRLGILVSLAGVQPALGSDDWRVVQDPPHLVKVRDRPGTDIREVWAEEELSVPPVAVQDAVMDVARFPEFMPYFSEARRLPSPGADGALLAYFRLELPFPLSGRDYIHKVYVDADARTSPDGSFANHWFAVPDLLPRRVGVVRLATSEGSWRITPLPGGRSHAVYRSLVDPGGRIPAFLANSSNTDGVARTFQAIEREARRRMTAQGSGQGSGR